MARQALFLIVFVLCLVGCAAPGPTGPASEESVSLFYPPLPNPPRLQYLTSFSSSRDVTGGGGGGLDKFLTGSDLGSQFPVKPYGVELHNGKLYVTDLTARSYVVFDIVGKRYYEVRGSGGGMLEGPANVTIDDDGTIYVCDVGRRQVLVFDADDQFVRAYGIEGQFKPIDVAIVGDRLYITDQQDNEVEVLDKRSGQLLLTMGGRKKDEIESPDELLFMPSAIEYYDGHIYVVETGNTRIKQYTLDGTFVRNFGGIGLMHGQFVRPKGMSIDRNGVMYVVDAAFANVQLISLSMDRSLMSFGRAGNAPGTINLPADVEIDYDNVHLFTQFADPEFKLEYVVLVTSQFGSSKVGVWGFGKLDGVDYPEEETTEGGQGGR